MLLSNEYNLFDVIRYNVGLSKSQTVLLEKDLKNPLPNKVNKMKLPLYFLMGKYDYNTSLHATKTYFNTIEAEKKEFITFEKSAHYPQFEEKEKFYKWMSDTFVK